MKRPVFARYQDMKPPFMHDIRVCSRALAHEIPVTPHPCETLFRVPAPSRPSRLGNRTYCGPRVFAIKSFLRTSKRGARAGRHPVFFPRRSSPCPHDSPYAARSARISCASCPPRNSDLRAFSALGRETAADTFLHSQPFSRQESRAGRRTEISPRPRRAYSSLDGPSFELLATT